MEGGWSRQQESMMKTSREDDARYCVWTNLLHPKRLTVDNVCFSDGHNARTQSSSR